MAQLSVALLGPLRVLRDGQPVAHFGYDKVRALFAYLVVEAQRAHDRHALAILLWPNEVPSVARKNLRTALAILRQTIDDATAQPPFLHITREAIQFNRASDYELDVDLFAALVADAQRHDHPGETLCVSCAALLARAVVLYRSDFAEQIEVAQSVQWEEWALLTRERVRGQVLDALARLMAFHEARGEDDLSRHYAWRALALEAWDEAAHRCLMRVYARTGQRAAALAQYERCCTVLSAEFGVAPSSETRALNERIRSGSLDRTEEVQRVVTVHAPPGRTSTLPIAPIPLIGRGADVATLVAQLQHSTSPLITLTGPPGIGKTRLCLALGAASEHLFADGVWFVSLASIHQPELVLPTIAQALDVQEHGEQPLLPLVQDHIRSKRMLLIVDNFEQVLAAAPLVADLLAAAPHVRAIVTSRTRLRLGCEYVFVVPPLALPDLGRLPAADLLPIYPAVQLFLERALAVNSSFALTRENAYAVAETCVQLDGLPLAIELAARRTTVFSVEDLLARLRQRLTLLAKGPQEAPQRHVSLRAAITWSYDLLNDAEQMLFRRCGVFVGGCSLDAVESACASDEQQQLAVIDALSTLVDQSLIYRADTAAGRTRFALLETIRAYALEQLIAQGEEPAMRQRHGDFFLGWSEDIAISIEEAHQAHLLDRIEDELGNVRAALDWFAQQQDAQSGLRLAGALFEFWMLRGYFSEGRGWIDRFLMLGSAPTMGRAKALYGAGALAYRQGNYAVAHMRYTESLHLYQQLGDERGIALSWNSLGELARNQRDYPLATRCFEASLQGYRRLHNAQGTAAVLNNLGAIRRDNGDFAVAHTLFTESLALYRRIRDIAGVAAVLFRLGTVARLQEDYVAERDYLEESLSLRRSIGDSWGMGYTLNNLGLLAASLQQVDLATARFGESLQVFQQLHDPSGIAMLRTNQGELARAIGAYDQAALYYAESLRLYRELDYTNGIAQALHNLGYVALYERDHERAATLFRRSLELHRDLGNTHEMRDCLAGLAGVAYAQEQFTWATQLLAMVDALTAIYGVRLDPSNKIEYERITEAVRKQLDDSSWARAWDKGCSLTLGPVVAYVLGESRHGIYDMAYVQAGS